MAEGQAAVRAFEHIADGLESKKIVWNDEAGLSYKKGRDWDDLIEKKKVEYDAKFLEEYGGGEESA